MYSSAVASLLRGTHVVIDARNEVCLLLRFLPKFIPPEADIIPSLIMRRVEVDAAIPNASRLTISVSVHSMPVLLLVK